MSERVIITYGLDTTRLATIRDLVPGAHVSDRPINCGACSVSELPADGELVLVGSGVGCSALAGTLRDAARDTVPRVRALILLAPTAPWAEATTVAGRCVSVDGDWWHTPGSCRGCRLDLGPLESPRGWFERGRRSYESPHCPEDCSICASGQGTCGPGLAADAQRLVRIIATCHQEAEICSCSWGAGSGYSNQASGVCQKCHGTGKALGSAEVVRELVGSRAPDDTIGGDASPYAWERYGGVEAITYPTRADHDREALGEVLRRLT